MALPPTLPAPNAAGLTLLANETEVFTPLQLTNYFSGAVRLSQVPRGSLYDALNVSPALPPNADGQPVAFISLHQSLHIATTWSWGARGANYTHQQAYTLLKQVLFNVNKDPTKPHASGVKVTDADVKAFRQTDDFAHFVQQELAGGWYTKFDALQGQQKTFWASGLNAFETVEFAVRARLDIANTYF